MSIHTTHKVPQRHAYNYSQQDNTPRRQRTLKKKAAPHAAIFASLLCANSNEVECFFGGGGLVGSNAQNTHREAERGNLHPQRKSHSHRGEDRTSQKRGDDGSHTGGASKARGEPRPGTANKKPDLAGVKHKHPHNQGG